MKLLHLDSSILGGNSASRQLSAAIAGQLAKATPDLEIVYRDLAADIVVIGAPMYNFGIPSQLKAWIDRIAVAGKTFRYTASGPEGLSGNKRVIIATSRGGFYGAGTPAAAVEHAESYLRSVFGLLGVTDLTFVVAEGLAIGPEQRDKAMQGALQTITKLSAGTQLRAA